MNAIRVLAGPLTPLPAHVPFFLFDSSAVGACVMDTRRSKDPPVKVLLIGDSGVGKSSLMLRFTADAFDEAISATIGIDFKVKQVQLEDGRSLTLQLWDTAGQERFRTLTSSFYRGAHAVVLVYDTTQRSTFDNLKHWVEEANTYCRASGGQVSYLLIGNKVDLLGESNPKECVSREEAEAFARSNRMLFALCSAKTKEGVIHAFAEVARSVAQKNSFGREDELFPQHGTADLRKNSSSSSGAAGGYCGC